jgi:hypothetical protein
MEPRRETVELSGTGQSCPGEWAWRMRASWAATGSVPHKLQMASA